ncbi:hypothetical protein Molly5_128 [Maribacter phage Molly_5]|uniref:Uncharacterized protein n=2 Tax=Mollyvirus TaxID=2948826 RepID=A0A8E4UXT1_9CAUD|nr:hypothetical protein M1M29_gp127 [Maribacter phage Molly_1]YP_010357374.1 hypothetical protein M1M30_gp125 [Maribacter phage Colly_1]QQO97619.1 hypothetical protein Molly2_127 [Maribacter phage Molly_2]QQO97819.1 hypothetical protein Molly3_127 [Maribacter phage Molly_3]QQO98020.1 hypothetical protein Molly4_128 [Maribacter phage Molly_4]QQO98220.1 hypothetical protein Molly5_128 [Maribacter phage Molly_5]QQO97224.1 hypothetical protein Colly1_125 [Maribacter phage Colly_1]
MKTDLINLLESDSAVESIVSKLRESEVTKAYSDIKHIVGSDITIDVKPKEIVLQGYDDDNFNDAVDKTKIYLNSKSISTHSINKFTEAETSSARASFVLKKNFS